MSNLFKKSLKEHTDLINGIHSLENKIMIASKKIFNLKKNNKKLFVCGNGGSAADSQHFSAELVGRFEKDRNGFPAICLSNDSYAITAIGNDYGFNNVFSRQLEALGSKDDILMSISTSGNSRNVIDAVKKAYSMGIYTIALLGKDGGELKDMVDLPIIVESNRTARIQEMHITLIHIICELIEAEL